MASKKKSKSQGLLIVGVFTLLAVGSWVGFDIYRGLTNTTLTEVQQKQIRPLRVSVDEEMVQKLRSRRRIEDFYLNSVESRAVPSEKMGGVGEVSEASQSGVVTETEEAGGVQELVLDLEEGTGTSGSAELSSQEATESANN